MIFDDKTEYVYTNQVGSIVFKKDSDFWVSNIAGINGVDVDIASSQGGGQVGSSVTSMSILPGDVTITGTIRVDSVPANREILINTFAPLVPATLTIRREDEAYVMEVHPKKQPFLSFGNVIQNFQVNLYTHYPIWRTEKEYAIQISGMVKLFKLPFKPPAATWYISRVSDEFFKNVYNDGNIPIQLRVKFTARSRLSYPSIYHLRTGRRITVNKAELKAGESVYVSTVYGSRGAVFYSIDGKGTQDFRLISKDSDMAMAILPGDNGFKADAATNRAGLRCVVYSPSGEVSGL